MNPSTRPITSALALMVENMTMINTANKLACWDSDPAAVGTVILRLLVMLRRLTSAGADDKVPVSGATVWSTIALDADFKTCRSHSNVNPLLLLVAS
eukprot:3532337-Amphidinium_carterae.1